MSGVSWKRHLWCLIPSRNIYGFSHFSHLAKQKNGRVGWVQMVCRIQQDPGETARHLPQVHGWETCAGNCPELHGVRAFTIICPPQTPQLPHQGFAGIYAFLWRAVWIAKHREEWGGQWGTNYFGADPIAAGWCRLKKQQPSFWKYKTYFDSQLNRKKI